MYAMQMKIWLVFDIYISTQVMEVLQRKVLQSLGLWSA